MQAGDKVRLIANPGRVGILSNETGGSASRPKVLVNFLDGTEEWFPLGALEKLERDSENPYQLIQRGRFGRVDDLRGAVTYCRLNGKLANLIYSLNSTNTEFLAYQFKPVLQFLDSPSEGILIADEVGLGKTIEAGLIWTELRARRDAQRLLVVCPAMLCEKWKRELATRFGMRADIVKAGELLQALKGAERDSSTDFALIASLQGLRPPKGWDDEDEPSNTEAARLARHLDDLGVGEPLLDLVVIDEAHYLRNRETQTYRLGELLRPLAQAMVLLTATPIHLRNTDLFNLVRMLDEDAFPSQQAFEWTLSANAPMVALRDQVRQSILTQDEFAASVQQAQSSTLDFYQDSEQLKYLQEHPPDDETLASARGRAELAEQLDRINPLSKVITRTLKRDVQEFRVKREPHVIKTRMSPPEADFYAQVTEKVREFCEVRYGAEGFILTIPQRQMASSMAAACRSWIRGRSSRAEVQEIVYELGEEIDQWGDDSVGPLLSELKRIAAVVGSFNVLAANDGKYRDLVRNLQAYWKTDHGRKVVLFSFFKDTLYYLAERLLADGIESAVLHGSMDKQEVLDRFEAADGPRILLSSEVASEGVDLQFSSLLINYDLPWNPAKIEQRIGRIDRIGQEQPKVLIWNLLYADTIDERVHDRLLDRLNIFRNALGSMEDTLGQQIGRLTRDLLSHKLTPQQELDRIDQARVALANGKRIQEQVEAQSSHLIAHGDFIQRKVHAANELGRYIRGEDLLAYVRDFFGRHFEGTRLLNLNQDELFRLELSVEARVAFEDFLKAHRLTGRTALLANPPPMLRFDNQMQRTKAGIEVIRQDHPLVRFVGQQIRAKGGETGYLPVSAIQVASTDLTAIQPGIYVYQVVRWSISGAREIERIEYLAKSYPGGASLDGDKAEWLVNQAALAGKDWLGAAGSIDTQRAADLQDNCLEELEDYFKQYELAQRRENVDRVRMMQASLKRDLARRSTIIEEKIRNYRGSGVPAKMRMIPAEEGKLKKERRRIEQRLEELELKADIQAQSSAVSAGLIRVG